MAFFQVNFFSKAIRRNVSFNALVPLDAGSEEELPKTPLKSLYLLNGFFGDYMDWICNTRIRQLSSQYGIAVFMPSGENSFYLDDAEKSELHSEYVGAELVEFTRKVFPLSDKREDTFIGGLSMGGYGAMRTGLKYHFNFGRIIALSSALIIRDVAQIPPDYKDPMADYAYCRRVFGELDKIIGSDKDPEALAANLKKEGKEVPSIYMACGTEDFLIAQNRAYHDFLNSLGIEHAYVEGPGVHDWKFWDEYIEKALIWALK